MGLSARNAKSKKRLTKPLFFALKKLPEESFQITSCQIFWAKLFCVSRPSSSDGPKHHGLFDTGRDTDVLEPVAVATGAIHGLSSCMRGVACDDTHYRSAKPKPVK